jgi:hypothetical protein
MDTKFWGPPGWKLLHVLTLTYEPSNATSMGKFLETLPYVLPCKFCRASLTDYYRELPFQSALKSRSALTKWLWQIHSHVNDKLRAQGQTIGPDPSISEVKTIYGRYIPSGTPKPCESFPGWDFLFSIAYNHPLSVRNSKPMPQTPTILKDTSDEELNKWNMLAPAKRLIHWRKFWELLPQVMPAPWASAWLKAKQEPILDSRRQTVAWLWRLRCRFADGADPYTVICNKLSSHESGCSKSLRARTCRRLRQRQTQKRTK